MAIVMQMTWDGFTNEQYDAARREVGMDTVVPAGLISHVAWQQGGAIHVCDVWETEEAFNTYVHDRLMPGIARAGALNGQPQVTVLPAHATLFGAQPALR